MGRQGRVCIHALRAGTARTGGAGQAARCRGRGVLGAVWRRWRATCAGNVHVCLVCLLRAFAAVLPMNPADGWLSGKAKRPAVRVGSHHGGQRPRWRHAAKCVSRERNGNLPPITRANKGKDHEPRERPATTVSRPWHARVGGPSARTSLGSPCAVPVQLSLGSASGPARSGLTMNALTEVPWRTGKPVDRSPGDKHCRVGMNWGSVELQRRRPMRRVAA